MQPGSPADQEPFTATPTPGPRYQYQFVPFLLSLLTFYTSPLFALICLVTAVTFPLSFCSPPLSLCCHPSPCAVIPLLVRSPLSLRSQGVLLLSLCLHFPSLALNPRLFNKAYNLISCLYMILRNFQGLGQG